MPESRSKSEARGERASVRVDVVGTTYIDRLWPVLATTPPPESHGGVGRNIAERLGRLGVGTRFVSAAEPGPFESSVRTRLAEASVEVRVSLSRGAYGRYHARLDARGEPIRSNVRHPADSAFDAEFVERSLSAPVRVFETGLSAKVIEAVVERAASSLSPGLFAMPTRLRERALPRHVWHRVFGLVANRSEAEQLTATPIRTHADALRCARLLQRAGPRLVVITLGASGLICATEDTTRYWPAPAVPRIANRVGAGDAFSAGLVAGLAQELPIDEAVEIGIRESILALTSSQAVEPRA